MFPAFVDEIELARYVKGLLSQGELRAVVIAPHRDAEDRPSAHVYDIYRLQPAEPTT
jgi:hypothetical protein